MLRFLKNRYDRCRGWHWWFAWYPVHIGHGEWLWLETVSRKWEEPDIGTPRWVYGNTKTH